jgi:hypothetical protein
VCNLQYFGEKREYMVKAENIYSAEHFKAAHKTSVKGKIPYVATAGLLLFTVLFSGWAFARCVKAANANRLSDAYILSMCAFCTVLFGFRIVKALVNRDKIFEKAAEKQHIRHFEVTENELLQTTDSEIEHSERHFVLSGLNRVYDTGKYFVIYLYADMYCIIGYQDIVEGTPDELRSLFYNAIGDKLKVI